MIKVLVVVIAVLMFVGVLTKIRSNVKPRLQEDASTLFPGPKVAQEKQKEKVILIATGDVVMGRSVNYQMVKYNNPLWPFEKVKDILSSGDITVVNIEAPFVKDCPTVVEGMVFCGREDAVKGLVASGVDVATLANNHISDFGVAGIENTVKILRDNNIDVAGLEGEILYKTVKGTQFAFLAFNDIYGSVPPVLKAERETIERLVGEARKNADVVVVSMHWGVEYRAAPDSRQIELAHLVIDAGADLIIGNHPHWIQNDEQYKNTYIKYAHGNLVFDQMWSEETKKGVIGKYTFEDGKLVDKEFTPIYIKDYGQPQILSN